MNILIDYAYFIIIMNNTISYVRGELNDILSFYSMTLEIIERKGKISLIDSLRIKQNMSFVSTISPEELNEENVTLQEIKMLGDKIFSLLKGRKEYDFIYDYFDGGSSIDISHFQIINEEHDHIENSSNLIHKRSEEFIKIIHSLNNCKSNSFNNLTDLLSLSSIDFLKNKIKLEDEEIKNLKGEENLPKEEAEKICQDSELQIAKSPKPKNFIDDLKSYRPKTNISNSNSIINRSLDDATDKNKQKIEKEIEEEINNEIFSYTKNMKHYARSFNEILTHDNRKLDKIEENQDKGQIKTDRSIKSLNEFNYSIKIGFWKMLLMFGIVFISFIMTLLSIRIFPKLV